MKINFIIFFYNIQIKKINTSAVENGEYIFGKIGR
jgi:hypothetical protein